MEIELCGYKVLIDDEDVELATSFTWFISSYHLRKGLVYFIRNTPNNTISLHRTIMHCTCKDGKVVDHISGNTLDNRKHNLRICSNKENIRNQKIHKNNTTGYKGVGLFKRDNTYLARIRVDGVRIFLGYFKTPKEAHDAYCEASKKYHGEFGRTE